MAKHNIAVELLRRLNEAEPEIIGPDEEDEFSRAQEEKEHQIYQIRTEMRAKMTALFEQAGIEVADVLVAIEDNGATEIWIEIEDNEVSVQQLATLSKSGAIALNTVINAHNGQHGIGLQFYTETKTQI